jgi:hypothetical protein
VRVVQVPRGVADEVYPKDEANPSSATCTVSGDGRAVGTFSAGPFSPGNGKRVSWLTPQLDAMPAVWSVSCK